MASGFTPEILWRLPRVGAPAVGGDTVVVPVTTWDLDSNQSTSRLFHLDPGSGEARPLTTPSASATRPAVSPDGQRLAFLRIHEDRKQVWVMDLSGGEAERLTDLPLGAHGCVWMPDSRRLVVVADVYAECPGLEATREERDRRRDSKRTMQATEHAVYRFWDTWLTGGEVPHLFLLEAETGELSDLTPASTRWMRWPNVSDPSADVAVSPDGRRVVFCADRSYPPHRDLRWGLFQIDLTTGEESDLAPDLVGHAHRPRFTRDGRLVYGMQRIPDFYADRVRLVVVDGEHHRVLTEEWDHSASDWEIAGSEVIFSAEDRARQHLWRLPLDGAGEPQRLAAGGSLYAPGITASGTVVAAYSTLSHPPEVVAVDDGKAVPLTAFTRDVMQEVELGKVEEITVAGARSEQIQAYLIHPPRPSREPPPLVHMIHGGPHAAWGDGWHWRWNAHTLAAAGYLVAQVNFHGSTSFGQAFAESIHGAWGEMPAADIEAATDVLVERGLVDPDRMAITGGSYGGYLVAWLIAQTDRYRCAVAHAAVTDLPGMYATDITMGRTRSYGAEVWEDLDHINRWSPAAHAAGYRTPTLVIHGERDYRVPLTQGLELYGVLKAKGVDSRLVYFPDENHWVLSPANSLAWHEEVLNWLDRWL